MDESHMHGFTTCYSTYVLCDCVTYKPNILWLVDLPSCLHWKVKIKCSHSSECISLLGSFAWIYFPYIRVATCIPMLARLTTPK